MGIASRLTISFSLIFAMVMLISWWIYLNGIPFTFYEGRIKKQRKETFIGLSLVADRKKEGLLRWIEERRGDTLMTAVSASVSSDTVNIRQRVYELTETGIDESDLWSLLFRDETYLDLTGHLRTIIDTYGYYDNIQIADGETGIVFISTDNSTLGTDLSSEPFWINALLTPVVYISDITARPKDCPPAIHFSHQVSDGTGSAVGVLVMSVEARGIIQSILQGDPFLGKSEEALLVNQSTEILTPLKHPLADGTIVKPLQYRIQTLPAKLASRGEEGIIETIDYRGVKVLSAYRHISLNTDWGWGMVVKTDYEALIAPIKAETVNSLIIGVVSVFVLIVLTFLVIRKIIRPIISLKVTAELITGGDMGARAEVASSDEVGILARAFNQMTDSLVKAKVGLEDQVRERTRELETEINEHQKAEEELIIHRNLLEELVKKRTAKLEGVNEEIRKSQQAMRYLLEDVNEARENLQVSNESLVRANRDMESFSYSVSHDLRTPLRAILGFSSKLEGQIGKAADQETLRLISVISKNTIKMQDLIRDLLDFSRFGRTELTFIRIDMQSLVSEICSNLVENTEGSILKFDILTLPDAIGSYPMIKQVFINLITNAVKFTRTVESPLITIGSQISEDETEYYVKDNGSGFDMKFSDKIFNIFTRLQNNGNIEGTGVGLAIVKQIIERHGGRIRAESEPEIGAAFYFTFSKKVED